MKQNKPYCDFEDNILPLEFDEAEAVWRRKSYDEYSPEDDPADLYDIFQKYQRSESSYYPKSWGTGE